MPDSALSPREIQARIRSGSSVADIVHATGMDPARVEAFAVPVIAEREFVAGQARSHVARRGGETIAHRSLAEVVADRLSPRGVDPDAVRWDAWRIEGRRWTVQVIWEAAGSRHEAHFVYDQAGRFSVADNDDANWLLGLHPPAAEPAPGEEAEPTVGLNDELALVRVVQPGAPFEDTEPIELDEDDAYAEGELEEVDGVYDIVTDTTGGIDVLYDMLAGFDEDSVQIYAGLVRPDADSPAAPVVVDEVKEPPGAEPPKAPKAAGKKTGPQPESAAAPAADPDEPEQEEPEQHSLFEETSEIPVKPARSRRKRAHVPSWDEIVFGSPTTRKPD
ncbi:MAG: DUF3071 domain-containing protein [Propionibacteriaceae bacterium]|nr:DUF3071 domain-containing protein [Propionibacteriaceae bacterium]